MKALKLFTLIIVLLSHHNSFGASHSSLDIFLPVDGISGIAYDVSSNSKGLIVAVGGISIANSKWTVRLSKDDGKNWRTVDEYLPPGAANSLAHAVAINSRNWIYVGGQVWTAEGTSNWIVRLSKNKGSTWTTVDTYSYGLGNNQLFRLATDCFDQVWAVGSYFPADPGSGSLAERGLLRKSIPNGKSWTLIEAELGVNFFGIEFTKKSILVAGLKETTGESDPDLQNFAFYTKKSQNLGRSWKTLDLFSFNGFVGGALNIMVDKQKNIWTVGNGWDETGVRRSLTRTSINKGLSWSNTDTYRLSQSGNSETYAIRELHNKRKVSAGYAVDENGLRHLIYRISDKTGFSFQTLFDFTGDDGLGAFPQQMKNGSHDSLLTAGGVICSSPCQKKWAVFRLTP